MSLLTYTFQKLQQAAQHASGIATPSTGSSWADLVNGAVQRLANERSWSWRERELSLDTVASQEYVNLPSDFQELVTAHRHSTWRECYPISMARLLRYRAQNIGQDLGIIGFFYFVESVPQASAASASTYRMQLYPTPTVNETGAIIGVYRRAIPLLSANSDIPDIPPGPWHEALMCLVRAIASSREDEQDGQDWKRYNEMLPNLMRLDGGMQGNLGMIDGGIETAVPDWRLYPSQITPG